MSSADAASTFVGDATSSIAVGIAAAKGKAKANEPDRPRNFLRDVSTSFILRLLLDEMHVA
jgi:hypothetical protein